MSDHLRLRTWQEVLTDAVKENRHLDFKRGQDFLDWVDTEVKRYNKLIAFAQTLSDMHSHE